MEQKVQGKETGGEGRGTDASPAKEISLRYENKRQVAEGGSLGFFIGLAVIVPGVSGSAVAIVFKLYEKLLYALGSFFRKFKTSLLFLLPIGIGLVAGAALGFFGVRELLGVVPFATVALLTVSKILSFIMERYRRGAFFAIAGLSLGSIATMFFNVEVLAVYRSWAAAFSWCDPVFGVILFTVGVAAAYFFVKCERKNGKKKENIKNLS